MASKPSFTPIATPDALGAVGPYSQAVKAGDFLFVSGQLPMEPTSGALLDAPIEAQAKRMIDNVLAVVARAGGDVGSIVKTTLYFEDLGHFERVNAVYAEVFGATLPARAAVQVAALPKGAQLEMEAVAHIPA